MIIVCGKCRERIGFGDLGECLICCGSFEKIDDLISDILEDLKDYEYENFDVGVRLYGSSKAIELFLKEKFGIEDTLKEDFKREFVRRFSSRTGKLRKVNGDVRITINLEDLSYEIDVSSVYIYGRYKKRVRGLAQTRWICGFCEGRGCEKCNYTGKKYLSIEDVIITPAIEIFKAENAFLHGAGREDVDARMLGNGRPFILEIAKPKKRKVDLKHLEEKINQYAKNRVLVKFFYYCNAKSVEIIKNAKFKKRYRAVVRFDREVDKAKLEEALKKLETVITQRTPKRVLHRRADKIRKRNVYSTKLILHRDNVAVIEILSDSGLYIKELVSGDEGRTKPSLSELLGVNARVEKLDVIEVLGGLEETLNTHASKSLRR